MAPSTLSASTNAVRASARESILLCEVMPMQRQSAVLVRECLSDLADVSSKLRERACLQLADEYGEKTQRLLYLLINGYDLAVRQQAALALRTIDEWTIAHPDIPLRGLYVACLGSLRVFMGARELPLHHIAANAAGRAGWIKVLGVFAYLIHRGSAGATRQEIGAAVWARPVSLNSLSRTMSALRQTLIAAQSSTFVAQCLTITPERAAFASDAYLTDVQLFEAICNVALDTEQTQGMEAATPFYTLAIERYAGPYLEAMPCADDTCRQRRHKLLNDFIIAIEMLAEWMYTAKNYPFCVALCQRGLDADPASQELTLLILRAWQALKRRGEFERSYRHYLRAAHITPQSHETSANAVVSFYQTSHRL